MINEPKPFEILLRAFPGIPHDEAEELIAFGEVRSFPAGTIICHENALASTFYIILQGKVKVSKFINQKKERELKTLKAGDFFGEMALIHNAPRAATVTTVMPTTVLEIKKNSFDRLMRRSASLAMTMAREVSRRLQENEAMAIEDLRIKAGEMAMAYQRLAEQEFTRREYLLAADEKLKAPVQDLFTDLDQLRQLELANAAIVPILDRMAENVQKTISTLNDLFFLHGVDMLLPQRRRVDLNQLMHHIVERNQPKADQKEVRIQVATSSENLITSGDPTSIERAMNILFNFAIDASPQGGIVQVEATQFNSGIDIEFQFAGLDYHPDRLIEFFEPFPNRFPNAQDQNLSRIGLPIARQIIEQHGGEISATDKNRKEKSFKAHLQSSL